MGMQTVVVFLVVAACSGYAVWALAPAAVRRAIALQMLRMPHPRAFNTLLQAAARSNTGCGGCGGCDKIAGKAQLAAHATPATHTLQFQPRRKH